MMIINLLLLLLIFLLIYIINTKNNLKTVIYFSAFSLISASVYYFLSAPDLALAEAAIGSAIIPLIYIIAISKQRAYLVISQLDDEDPFLICKQDEKGIGYRVLEDFTQHYNLKLEINQGHYDELHGIFRKRNIDLVVIKCKDSNDYLLKGKSTSLLMNKLEELSKAHVNMKVVRVDDGEKDD